MRTADSDGGARGREGPAAGTRSGWTEAQAEQQLRSLELFGMRFGLDRMRRMMTALGSPERRFPTIHVLGTNGKSSTTRMIAAILERHGLRTGAYLSPHLVSYRERVRIGERELDTDEFAEAVARASHAADRVNRTLGADDHVTQFELLTAAAFSQMAEEDVEVGVIEAGLGGRYDATSVIDASVTVLTNVGLEHTRWLGPTLKDIAEEKLAAVRDGATLVIGEDLAPAALAVAERVAGERGARIERRRTNPGRPRAGRARRLPARQLRARLCGRGGAPGAGGYRAARGRGAGGGRRTPTCRAACSCSRATRRRCSTERTTPTLPRRSRMRCPRRSRVVRSRSCSACSRTRTPRRCSRRCCRCASARGSPRRRALARCRPRRCSRSPASSASIRSTCEPHPHEALAQAREWARAQRGAVLATGSVYLVGDLLAGRAHAEAPRHGPRRRSSR